MKTQDLTLYALIIFVLYLLFVRKVDGFCGACAAGGLSA